MGNHPSKQEAQASPQRRPVPSYGESASSSIIPTPPPPSQAQTPERPIGQRRRSSRHDLGIFSIGGRQDVADPASPEARRETRPEREARRLERERAQRAVDRERSTREEHIDGGFLVTLGTYTGTEDFSKPTVRRLQIERRLAPFWKGLQDHEDDWKDNQLVALVKGQPLPEPEENVVHARPPLAEQSSSYAEMTPESPNTNIVSQSITISASPDSPFNTTPNLSPSHPAFSTSFSSATFASSSPPEQATHKNPLLRGRAKTLASLASLSRYSTQEMLTPQEKQLPHDPYYNGIPLEAVLYRNASECPICFLYYPPYLNRTRCCDQPICSECFVQIKRPDPHPPEHAEPSASGTATVSTTISPAVDPSSPLPLATEYQLVSEPATCPFCKTPELGVTYESPPFRRGISYGNTLSAMRSAMSSASSINSQGVAGHSRRRNLSISADAPNVITTDQVRPDWSKKLSDARAQALRRAAAATALHNAAYVMNMGEGTDTRLPFGGRRRRTLFSGPPDHSPLPFGPVTGLLGGTSSSQQQSQSATPEDGRADHVPGRVSSRRRIEDIEQMMMEEAIRQSIAMEEERKRKDEKEAAKQSKKEEKQKTKEGKKSWRELRRSSASEAGESSSAAAGKAKAAQHDASTTVGGGSSTIASASLSAPTLHFPSLTTCAIAHSPPAASPALPIREPPPVPIAMSRSHSNASSLHDSQQPPSPFTFGPNGSGISLEGSPFNSDTSPGATANSQNSAAAGEQVFGFRSLDEVIGDDATSSPTSPAVSSEPKLASSPPQKDERNAC